MYLSLELLDLLHLKSDSDQNCFTSLSTSVLHLQQSSTAKKLCELVNYILKQKQKLSHLQNCSNDFKKTELIQCLSIKYKIIFIQNFPGHRLDTRCIYLIRQKYCIQWSLIYLDMLLSKPPIGQIQSDCSNRVFWYQIYVLLEY